jgi:hypothetical protein
MGEGLQVEVSRSSAANCPYCRDALAEDEAWTCAGCGIGLHDECLAELTRCPSLGCPTLIRDFRGVGESSPSVKQAVRAGFRRGLAVGLPLLVAVLIPLFLGSGRVHFSDALEVGLIGLLMGFVVLPAAVIEHVLGRREASLPAQLLGATGSGLGGWLMALLAFCGSSFAHWIHRGLGRAFEEVAKLLRTELWAHPEVLAVTAVPAFAITLVTFLRLRGTRLSRQLVGSAIGVLAFAGLLALLVPMKGPGQVAYWVASGVGALALPLAEWLLDAVHWRAWLRLGKSADGKGPKSGDPKREEPSGGDQEAEGSA